jgi:hypothetical protein
MVIFGLLDRIVHNPILLSYACRGEHFLRHHAFGNFRHRPSHADRKVVANFNGDDTAGHMDGNRAVTLPLASV